MADDVSRATVARAPATGEGSKLERTANRPARTPGGCECFSCGRIFIGEPWHTKCAICHPPADGALGRHSQDMGRQRSEPKETGND